MTTKRNLVLVSLFLVFGLVAMAPTALAQTQWQPGANQNNYARAEGIAEATGQVTLTQSNSSTGTVGAGTEFIIFYTTGTTSGSTPNIGITDIGTVNLHCTGTLSSPWAGTVCNGIGTPWLSTDGISRTHVSSGPVLHIPFVAYSPGANGVIFPGTGGGAGSFLAVTVRLDVSGTPLTSPVGYPQASMYPHGGNVQAVVTAYTPSGVPNFSIQPFQPSAALTVMAVQPDPALGIGFGWTCNEDGPWERGPSCEQSETAYVLLCLGVISNIDQYERYFTIDVSEIFAHALTSSTTEQVLDPANAPNITPDPIGGAIVSVVFQNIPTNFGLRAGDVTPCSVYEPPAVPCPNGMLLLAVSGQERYWNSTPGNTGTVTFEYIVAADDAGFKEDNSLSFKFFSAGPIGTSALPCVTAVLYKQPNDYPTMPGVVPKFHFVPETAPLPVICFNNCETNLLFPMVVSYAPWDTNIVVANTTMDPLAIIGAAETPVNTLLIKGSATPQDGVCYAYFYSGYLESPFNSSRPAGPLATFTTPIIYAGTTWGTTLGAYSLIPPGTEGYLWVKCMFSQAYGYALITEDFGAPNGIAANYLAITIPDPEWSPRDYDGDGMGENSTTPLNLTRELKKALAGFSSSCIFCGP